MGKHKKKLKNAIFLDRDGVLNKSIIRNKKPFSPRKLSEVVYYKHNKKLFKEVKKFFVLFVITNQPDVANKKMTKRLSLKIHKKILSFFKIPFNHTAICFHKAQHNCNCRKPKPGMIYNLKKLFNISLKNSYLIGDREKDILAGNKAGLKSIFIDRKYSEKKPLSFFLKTNTLDKALKKIIKIEKKKKHAI